MTKQVSENGYRCEVCDNYSFTHEELQRRLGSVFYYQLSWFHQKVYDYFMKSVFPEVMRGWKSHNELIQQGHIAHIK